MADDREPLSFWTLPERAEGTWGARRELAGAVRELALRTVRTEADELVLREAAAAVRTVLDALPEGPTSAERFQSGAYGADPMSSIDRTALMGHCNPTAPPMVVTHDDEGVATCHITFTESHQGAPGMTHGGWVSAVLDQLAGYALMVGGGRGFTGKLTIRYLKPTPLNKPLVCRGWTVERAGRTATIGLEILLDGNRIVEGECLMVMMDRERAQNVIRGAH